MPQALEMLCTYSYRHEDYHQFTFLSADYKAVNEFCNVLAQIEQTRGWYDIHLQKLIIDASMTSYIPLRYLFETLERFQREHHHGRYVPAIQWAVLQPEMFQLHHIAQLYMEQSTYPMLVRFFSPFAYDEALHWLGHSNSE